MTRIHAMALAMSLLLVAGGCGRSVRTENPQIPRANPVSAKPKTSPASPCLEREGFAVFGFRAIRDSFGQVSVVGEIKNTGPGARGVELQASLRDAGGRLVAVGHFCPASNRNIAPNGTWPFSYSFGRQEDALDAELRIVGSFRTTDILNPPSTTP